MAARKRLRGLLREKKGDAAVEIIFTTAMLILVFSVLVTALVYVTEYYNASYICRRVVRTIETSGEYDRWEISELAETLGGDALDDLRITVNANFLSGKRIQLREEFNVKLAAVHRIDLMMFKNRSISINLPIQVMLSGRSEVFWK